MRSGRVQVAALVLLSLFPGCAGGRPRAALSAKSIEQQALRYVPDGHPPLSRESLAHTRPDAQSPTPRDSIQPVHFENDPSAAAGLDEAVTTRDGATTAPADPTVVPETAVPGTIAPETGAGAATTITLASLEAWALHSNPTIRQASASAQKAMGYRQQVGRLPNPTVGYQGVQLGDAGTDQHLAFLTQDIVLGDKLHLNDQVLGHGVQSQLWEVEAQRFRVLTDVRVQFYEALAAQQRLEAAEEFREVLVKGVAVAEARKEAQEGAQPEVLLARIQKNEIDLIQRRAQFAFDAAWQELAATVGQRQLPLASLEVPPTATPGPRNWDAVYSDLIARSPELRAANAIVCRAAANVQRQEAQPIPNLQLEVAVGHDQATDQQFGQVQAGVPIPVFNNNRGNIDAAQAEYCRAQQNVQRLRMALSARLAAAAREFDSARVAVEQYEQQILPQAAENLKLSEQAYAAGEFGFLEVLTSRRVYFEALLELIDARRELAQAAASIDGLLLAGGLSDTVDSPDDDALRGQALSGQ